MYANDFPVVAGMYLEDFVIRSAEHQVRALDTRFKNKTFAMHVRMKQNPGFFNTTVLVNLTSLELLPAANILEKRARGG